MPRKTQDSTASTPLLKERIRALFRRLPKGLAGDEESIHQMRVAGRRLRVALPILARKPDGRRVRRARAVLRQVTRAAGASRDLDVITTLFEERLEEIDDVTPELQKLRQRLRAARSRSRARMAEALMDLEIARLRRDLRAVVARKGEELFTVMLRLRRTRDVGGAALLSAIRVLGDRFEPDALHRLRIRSRRLRYAAELNAAVKGESAEAADLLQELQDRLGHIHDAHVLALWFQRQRNSPQLELAAEASRQEAWFLEQARGHHHMLLQRNPTEIVERALEAMGRTRSAA
jgi:CHAD domain-containing protein